MRRFLPMSVLCVCLLPWGLPALRAHTDVTPAQAHDLVGTLPGLIVLDVRETSEYCPGHIPGALNYPWSSGVLKARYGEIPQAADVLVVCASGSRSNQAATFLDGKGYTALRDMTGGMGFWQWEKETCTPPAPKDLLCAGGPGRADLSWTAQAAYDLVRISRDGVKVAELPGGTANWADTSGLPGTRTYEVRGVSGTYASAPVSCTVTIGGTRFVRGDVNDDRTLDLADAVSILGLLFLGEPERFRCPQAADLDAGGALDISDALSLLSYLFLGGPAPAAPYPACGPASQDAGAPPCEASPGCP